MGVGWCAGGAWPGWPGAAAHRELPPYYLLRALPLLASHYYCLLSPSPRVARRYLADAHVTYLFGPR